MLRNKKAMTPRGGKPPAPAPNTDSLVVMYDELTRNNKVLVEGAEEQFLQFAINQEFCRKRWEASEIDVERLQVELAKWEQEVRKLEMKLGQARDLLAAETTVRKKAEQDREVLQTKWDLVRKLIATEQGGQTLNDDTRMKLQKLDASLISRRGTALFSPHGGGGGVGLSPINENNSTCSILDASDLSFDNTQGSVLGGHDESKRRSGRVYKRRSSGGLASQNTRQEKRTRSSGHHVAGGSLEAMAAASKSVDNGLKAGTQPEYNERNIDQNISSAPSPEDSEWQMNNRNLEYQHSTVTLTPSQTSTTTLCPTSPYTPGKSVRRANSNTGMNRKHKFVQKNCFKTESCPCGKRIKFGKVCFKCSECRAVSHPDCRDRVPIPCIPTGSAQKTPSGKGGARGRVLADHTPYTSPMVPALIVYCLNEVESRGLDEVGLYRVPGSEREVKDLRDKFLAGRGCPNLGQVDVHVLCGTVKDFLRSLREPLIPQSMWIMFTQAAVNPDTTDGESELYQAISELPQPNRDTLAFVMLHLQNVSMSKECKMNVSNLSEILGPTIVGYSSRDPQPVEIMQEVAVQASTMERLIKLDRDYWASFISEGEEFILTADNTPEQLIFSTPGADNTWFTPQRMSLMGSQMGRTTDISRNIRSDKIFASPVL